jgi:ribosomal protein L16 Arg81 hydroxylase
MSFEKLLAPVSMRRFLAHHWEERPLYVRGRRGKFAWLGFGVDELRACALREAGARFKAAIVDAQGNHREVRVDPRHFDEAFAAGMTLCLGDVDRFHAAVADLAASAKEELGLAGKVAFASYLSPDGGGFGMHFDQHEVFTLQIAGTKRWRYSARPAVLSPQSDLTAERDAHQSFLEEHPWARFPLPRERDLVEAVLRPGDVLYMPAGTWHRARGEGFSLALSMTCVPLSVGALIADFLEERLTADRSWRRSLPAAPRKVGVAEGLPRNVAGFCEARLEELRRVIATLEARDLAGAWLAARSALPRAEAGREPAPLRVKVRPDDWLTPSASIRFAEDAGGVRIFGAGMEMVVDRDALGCIRRVFRARRFVARNAAQWLGSSWRDAKILLEALAAGGFLRVARSNRL